MTPPFAGLPLGWHDRSSIWRLVVILGMLAWTALLFSRARRARRHAPEPAAGRVR